jgi:steroid 5-alpha reductase family enzyme
MSAFLLAAMLAAGLSVAMAGVWLISRRPGASGWTDVVWSYAVGLAGGVGALAPISGSPTPRQWLVAALAGAWSLRLGTHIARRIRPGHDDPRYAQLRSEWGVRFPRRLFAFLQIQAVAGWLLAISILLAARNPSPAFAWSDIAGSLLLCTAIAGEAVADAQLRAFARSSGNRVAVCQTGLWSLSRHPNYFFEWLGWCGYAVIAIGPGGGLDERYFWGWLSLSGPVFMYWLLVHVSGIPPLEAHMLRSRGEAFRDTQRRIRAFWPVPRLEEHPKA